MICYLSVVMVGLAVVPRRLWGSWYLILFDNFHQVKSDAVYVTNTGRIIDKNIQEKITVVIDDILDGPEENETEDSVGVWAKQKFQTAVDKTPLSTNPDDKKWLNASVLDWAHRFQVNSTIIFFPLLFSKLMISDSLWLHGKYMNKIICSAILTERIIGFKLLFSGNMNIGNAKETLQLLGSLPRPILLSWVSSLTTRQL